jgi:hypothetical protein
MTSQLSSSDQLGEEAATHRRIADGVLFRAGPDGRAETFSGGSWVPAGWKNADLLQSPFTPLADRSLAALEEKERFSMPMDFLREIEKAEFPLPVEDFTDVNNVAVLKAAGLIEAEMIEAVDGDPDTTCAVVVRITPEGYAALAGKIHPGI